MNGEEYQRNVQDMIYLVSCAVNGTGVEENRIRTMDFSAIYAIAKYHMLTASVALALESAGYRDDRFLKADATAIRNATYFKRTLEKVKDRLESSGIWYMLLKGAVLKDLYPWYWMREMTDHDILIDPFRTEDVRNIMEDLGFITDEFGYNNHDVFFKEPVLNFEMHADLFESGHEEILYQYYKDVKKKLIPGNGCEYHFTSDDFYIYMISHEYKHYSDRGTGLRSLLDTYVYICRRGEELNWQYITGEMDKLGMTDFEAQNRRLALHLFGEGELSETDQEMLEYFLSSGYFGTMDHRVHNQMKKNGWGKKQYILNMWNRFIIPISRKNRKYNSFAVEFPLFYKYKVLLLVLPFYRTFLALKTGQLRSELRALKRR